jgi:class 3 adenylate cyclase
MSTCSGCSAGAKPGARFCSACGRALGRGDDAGERRWVTVLFADLSGFTAFARQRDPEEVRALVDGALGRLGRIVEEHGGTVARVIGDEVLALFGAPVAHGDDADRAVLTGLAMQRLVREDPEALAGLALRVGVNTGEVLYAPLGTGAARVPTVTGDPANLAKRLEEAACPGEVLLGDATARAVRRTVATRPRPPLALEGREPVPVHQAVEALPARGNAPSPFVGRAAEVGLLSSIWESVVSQDRPHLVTVVGPPGIGKTRLAAEAVARLHGHATRVLQVRCLPYGGRTGYGPLAAALGTDLGLTGAESRQDVRERLEARAQGLRPDEPEQTVAVLSTLLGGAGSAPRADRDLLILTLRRWLVALARETPTVLLVEDLHWADTSLLELLPALAGRLRDVPLLVLVLARPALLDRAPSWGAGLTSASTLTLGPLSATESEELAGRLLEDADPARRTAVCDLAAGNPLFLEEIGSAVEEGVAVDRLPTTVAGILASRLDALSPRARAVLLDASVLGKLVDVDALAALSGRDGLDLALDELEDRDLLRRSPSEGWLFKHMTVREVAYGTLPHSVRRERHRAVAQALQGAVVDGRRAALVAHHWVESGEPDRATPWLLLAADLATRTWAKAEAVALYDEALARLDPQAPGTLDVRLRRATALYEHGALQEAAAELTGLMPRLEGTTRADALLVLGFLRFNLMDADGVLTVVEELLPLAEHLDDERRGPAYGLQGLAMTLSGDNRRGIALIQQGLQEWVPGTREVERVQFEEQIALSRQWACEYDEALAIGRRAGEAARSLCLTSTSIRGASQEAMTLAGSGWPVEAMAVVDRALAEGAELEAVPQWQARCWNVRAGVLRELHDLPAAREANARAISCGIAASFLMPQLQGQVDLMLTDLLEEHHEQALAQWPALWEHVDDAKGWHGWLMRGRLLQLRADLVLHVQGAAAALPAAERALEHAVQHERRAHEVLGRLTLSRALLALDRVEPAGEEAVRAQAIADALGHPVSRWQAAGQHSHVLAACGDQAGAEAAARAARDVVEAFAAGLPAPYNDLVRARPHGL